MYLTAAGVANIMKSIWKIRYRKLSGWYT
jgi:hypothetical protein